MRTVTGRAATVPVLRRRGTAGRLQTVRDVLAIWLLSRLLFEGIAYLTVRAAGVPEFAKPGFFGLLFNWDSGWFICLAQGGYFGACAHAPLAARPSFFPGYPLAARAVSWALGGHILVALWLIVFVSSFVAGLALYELVRESHGRTAARMATTLFLLGPYAVFLVASYSEALFLTFAIPAWLAVRRRHYALAGVLAAGASATRINGLFLVVALIVLYLQQARPWRIRAVAWLSVGFGGTVAYFCFLWATTGHPNAWHRSEQDYFARSFTWPWTALTHQLQLIRTAPAFDLRTQQVLELVAMVVLVAALFWLARRRDWGSSTYVLLSLATFATGDGYLSVARFVGTAVFPVYLVAGAVFARRHRALFAAVLALSVALAVLNTVYFARGFWTD